MATITGTSGDDSLLGGSTGELIRGGDGNDTLDGGSSGQDTLRGGGATTPSTAACCATR